MKYILLILLLSATGANSQTLNALVNIPGGVAAEIGVKNDTAHWGGMFGLEANFQSEAELALYFKGHYQLTKWIHFTGLFGVQDFNRIVTGIGVRGLIPVDEKRSFVVEPMWHSEGSRLNMGIQFKL